MKIVELTDKALEDASYSWQNFTPMCVSWRQMIRRNDDPPPYDYKEPARIVWNGSTIMEGTVRRCRPSFSGNSWAWNIEVHDILKPLEGTLCFNASGSLKGALYAGVEGGSGADAPRKVSIAGTVARILKDARKYGLLGGGGRNSGGRVPHGLGVGHGAGMRYLRRRVAQAAGGTPWHGVLG